MIELSLDKKISFNEAWRDFLIVRGIPSNFLLNISTDPKKRVIKILFLSPFPPKKINGKSYLCDNSSIPDTPICYPQSIVLPEVEKKIIAPLLGKSLEKQTLDKLRNKHKELTQKLKRRLGRVLRTEVMQLVSDERYFEALLSLHQILIYRLRKLLIYKSMDVDAPSQTILINHEKKGICENLTKLKTLADAVFLSGAIDHDTREKTLSFNALRNDIAHDLLTEEIPNQALKTLCDQGLKLMDALKKSFSNIIKKPDFLIASKFEVASYLKANGL